MEGHHFIAFTNLKSQPIERSSDLDFLIFLALVFDEKSEKTGYVQLPVRMVYNTGNGGGKKGGIIQLHYQFRRHPIDALAHLSDAS